MSESTLPECRRFIHDLQTALVKLGYPTSFGRQLLCHGVTTLDCLSRIIDGKLYRTILTDSFRVGHLISIKLEMDKLEAEWDKKWQCMDCTLINHVHSEYKEGTIVECAACGAMAKWDPLGFLALKRKRCTNYPCRYTLRGTKENGDSFD